VLGLLYGADDGKFATGLKGSTLSFAMLAARNFHDHPGQGLGMTAFQGCAVYMFAKPIDTAAFSKGPETSTMGLPVWLATSRSERNERDPYFITLPKPTVILSCNDRNMLSEVLSRVDNAAKRVALPQDFPEWKHVDRSAPLWALRHFFPERPAVTPSDVLDREATGVVGTISESVGTLRALWLTEGKFQTSPWDVIVKADEFAGRAQTRQVSDGIWELSAPTDAVAGVFGVFALMTVLGFAVYL
jgi:hypothetical protein